MRPRRKTWLRKSLTSKRRTGYIPSDWAPARSWPQIDRKSTRLNSSHTVISYAVFCLKKKIEIERLAIKDVICQAFLQEINQIFRRSAAHESRLHAIFFHHAPKIIHKCERHSACSR